MTDVPRTGPPRRLEDRTRFGIPIEGEVEGIWQRAFHVHLAEEVGRQPDVPGAEFFEVADYQSRGDQVPFRRQR